MTSAPTPRSRRALTPQRTEGTAAKRTGSAARTGRVAAEHLPVARVCVDIPLPHLDRPFDYLVPQELDDRVVPGGRVRVRFAGQRVDGYVLERVSSSDHPGELLYVDYAGSAERVLDPEIADLARAVADRYAGTLADVLRLAIPPRHAAAEAEPEPPEPTGAVPLPDPNAGWCHYTAGPAYLRALRQGRPARAVWTAMPGEDWPTRIAEAVAATLAADRGAVVIVPDARDLARMDRALTRCLGGADRHVVLAAALGPRQRYRRFLAASRAARRGWARAVVGTRAAMFAPVARLGLVVIWDDGDDQHAEPRAPYPHAREVLLTRAARCQAGVLLAGYTRTAEGQLLLETGWAHPLVAHRAVLRERAPRVIPAADDVERERDPGAVTARFPSVAWRAARRALAADTPVLVQVPRRGYIPAVACMTCRTSARCPHCSGPLALPSATAAAVCRWCARVAVNYACPTCGGRALRASVIGARRTAEEMGRALPGVPVRTSGRDEVLDTVPGTASLVVATPGAEPIAEGGYGAVLLLDTWALLTRADLRAGEETLRRWLSAAALARPASAGGQVVVIADGGLAVVQALLRFDPGWYAERELAERRELGFPPAVRMASLTGTPEAVADLLSLAELPAGVEELGPVELPEEDGRPMERMLLRARRAAGPALARALHAAAGVRSVRRAPDPIRIQIDPLDLL